MPTERGAAVDVLKEKLRSIVRTELTSGDAAVAELTNALLKAIRDRVATEGTLLGVKDGTDRLDIALSALRDAIVGKLGEVLSVKLAGTDIALPTDVQYRRKESLTLFSGTVTASGSTADISVSDFSAMELEVKVTGVSGTSPSLSVYIEGKFTATGDYKPLVYVENISSTNIWYLTVTQLIFRTIRVRWVVGGTSPSFTFTVAAEAVV